MRSVVKWAIRVVVALIIVAAIAALWKREEITRLLAVNSLFSEEKIVGNFSNMRGAFLNTELSRGDGPVSELPKGPTATMPSDLSQWVADRSVTSLVVLKEGELVFEEYYLGTTAEDLRISWSVAKSYLSAAFGIAVGEGHIADLDALVTDYVPRLKGGAYNGVTIRNVLQMSSGILFDEDYLDYDSDINRMGRVLALGGTMDGFAAGLTESFAAPGAEWKYTSIDTHVLGMVLRAATGRSVPDYMQEKLIAPMGLEAAPYYLTDGEGVAFVLGGLNLRSRDYARLGLMFVQDGMLDGQQIVPAAWVRESTTPSARTKPGEIGYGYQWWMPVGSKPGQFLARGIYGQYIYIDRNADAVVVITSADRQFREPGVNEANVGMMRAIVAGLQ